MLNILLGYTTSIAPESHSTACTATVCRFRYNNDTSGDKLFRAEVCLKSKQAVEAELEKLFDEIKLLNEYNEEDMAFDQELFCQKERLDQQVNLVASWSQLASSTVRELGVGGNIASIIDKCRDASTFFNLQNPSAAQTLYKHHKTAKEFEKMMRQLMGATKKAQERLIWPLIDVIDVYCVSNILKNGIVLVDLPGEMDALVARSDVARREYRNLDLLLVATPSVRAADNRTAMDLIRRDQIVDLEAQGKMGENSLAVVITKADQLDWTEFGETEMEDDDKSTDFLPLREKYLAKLDELEKLDELNTVKKLILCAEDEHSLSRQERLRKELDELNGKCLKICIDARAHHAKTKFQDYFDHIRNSFHGRSEAVKTTLPVFPISSKAQKAVLKRKASIAFSDDRATGFYQLSHWLKRSSLGKRDLSADKALSQLTQLYDAIETWTDGGVVLWAMAKLPQSHLPGIQKVLDVGLEDLCKVRPFWCSSEGR